MSTLQLEEETVAATEVERTQEEARAELAPFPGAFKRMVHRFVNWINNVDVDGQEYWS